MEVNPSALLECLHLEILGVRVSLRDSLVKHPKNFNFENGFKIIYFGILRAHEI